MKDGNEFGKVETSGALYAKKNLSEEDLKPYKDSLDKALKDRNITNIAITAPYGIGKSTVLENYFKKRKQDYPWYYKGYNATIEWINNIKSKKNFSTRYLQEIEDYEFINLPNFFSKEESKTEKIQQNIIEQLLFKSKPSKFPFSKIKRIKDSLLIADFFKITSALFILFILAYFYLKVTDRNLDWFSGIISLGWFNESMLILMFSLLVTFCYRKICILLSKSTINSESKFGPLSLSTKEQTVETNESNLFNIFSEELLYYFRKSKRKIIIFEDLDRFEEPSIFQKLRELNLNINKRQPKVVFIYSLQDKVFNNVILKNNNDDDDENNEESKKKNNKEDETDENVRLKAKFFDYVIPIFPASSFYNTHKTIENELKRYQLHDKFEESFLKQLGFFLKDVRMIILLISEFNMYINLSSGRHEKDSTYYNKLLSLIIYKNFFPSDFEKLSYGKSKLNSIFDNAEKFYHELFLVESKVLDRMRNEKKDELEDISKQLKLMKKDVLETYYHKLIRKNAMDNSDYNFRIEDKVYYWEDGVDFFQDLNKIKNEISKIEKVYRNNNSGNSIDVKNIVFENGKEILPFKLLDSESESVSELFHQIKEQLNEINWDIINLEKDYYDLTFGEVLQELNEISAKEEIDSFIAQQIKYISDDSLRSFLFYNNLIDKNFYYYVSPTGIELDASDLTFIKNTISRKNYLKNQKITNRGKVYEELKMAKADFRFAYSSDLLIYLLNSDNIISGDAFSIVNKIIEKDDTNFLDDFLKGYTIDENLSMADENIEAFLQRILNHDSRFILEGFKKISNYSKTILSEMIINSIEKLDIKVDEEIMNKLLNLIINDLNGLHVINKTFNTNLLERYSQKIFIESLEKLVGKPLEITETNAETNIDTNSVNKIISYGLYEANKINFSFIMKYLKSEEMFSSFIEKLNKIDIHYINKSELFQFFTDVFAKKDGGEANSYDDFEVFRNYFESEVSKVSMVKVFSMYSLPTISYEKNEEILKKIEFFELVQKGEIDKERIEQLVKQSKISLDVTFLKYLNENHTIKVVPYLCSIDKVNSEILIDCFNDLIVNINEQQKLLLLKSIDNMELETKLINSLDGIEETWKELAKDNSFFDEDLIRSISQIGAYDILRELTKVSSSNNKSIPLRKILKGDKVISINSLEEMLEVDYVFSEIKPDGKTRVNLNPEVPGKIIQLFEDLNIIKIISKKNFTIILKANTKKYFDV